MTRICIPTNDDRGLASTAATHFGPAPCFTVVDLDSGAVTVKPNPSCHQHPSDCHHVDLLRAQRVDVVVCSGIGRRALLALEEAGIEVLYPPAACVEEIADAVREGRATRLNLAAACAGSGGHPGGGGETEAHRHGRGHGDCCRGREETRA